MSKKTEEKPPVPTGPLTSLAEIQKLCSNTRDVVFELNGRECRLPVRQLTPAEEARVSEVINSVMPSIIKGKTPDDDRVDYTNPEFIKRKNEAAVKGRALALYWAVPAFQEARPGLTDEKQITDYIQGQLNETVLNLLNQAAREGGVTLAEVVNFT